MTNSDQHPQSDQTTRIARARRRSLVRRAVWSGAAVFLLAVLGYGAIRYGRMASRSMPGVAFEGQGQDHVPLGTAFSYNSNPPTSGPHFAEPSDWGVFEEEIPDQVLIHNLEHGGVWIAYRPDTNPDVVGRLEAIAKAYGRKVIMAPRSANDADISLAAWQRLDVFPAAEFSEARVRRFIEAFRNKGPEFVP